MFRGSSEGIEGDFGLGLQQDPYQLAATLFAIYGTAKVGGDEENGDEELKEASSSSEIARVVNKSLSRVCMGSTVLYFFEMEQEGFLTVGSIDARFAPAIGRAVLAKFSQNLSIHGLSTSNSPRQSTLKAIDRELGALLTQTAKELVEQEHTVFYGQSDFSVTILGDSLNHSPETAFVRAIEQAVLLKEQQDAGCKQEELQRAKKTAQSSAALQAEITAIYVKYNPGKLADLPKIFAEWEGREEVLLSAARFKYEGAGEGGNDGGENESKKMASVNCGCLLLPWFRSARVLNLPETLALENDSAPPPEKNASSSPTVQPTPEPEVAAHVFCRRGPSAFSRGLDALFIAREWLSSSIVRQDSSSLLNGNVFAGSIVLELRVRATISVETGGAGTNLISPEATVVVQDLESIDSSKQPAEINSSSETGLSDSRDCLQLSRLGPLLLVREVRGDALSPAVCGEWLRRTVSRPEVKGGGDAALLVAHCLRNGLTL